MKNKIAEALREIVKTDEENYSVACKVISVDNSNKTCKCEVISSGLNLFNVRLMSNNNTGFLIIPKVNSIVLVTMLNKFTGYVGMFSEVEEIQLNGDSYDGLVRIGDLVDKLNNLENALNQHLALYNAHTHAGVTSGISSTAVPSAIDTNVLTPTTQIELENLTVKHGNG